MSSFETKDIPFMTLPNANKEKNCTYMNCGMTSTLSMLQSKNRV